MARLPFGIIALVGASILVSSTTRGALAETLVEPKILIVDQSLPKATLNAEILAARRYDTFWNTGDPALAEAALSKDFVDETPPPLQDEFDQLDEEGATRRRMMAISLHDRISDHAGCVRALDRFLAYAKSKDGVWFARKGEIAKYTLSRRETVPFLRHGSPHVTGLPGPTA